MMAAQPPVRRQTPSAATLLIWRPGFRHHLSSMITFLLHLLPLAENDDMVQTLSPVFDRGYHTQVPRRRARVLAIGALRELRSRWPLREDLPGQSAPIDGVAEMRIENRRFDRVFSRRQPIWHRPGEQGEEGLTGAGNRYGRRLFEKADGRSVGKPRAGFELHGSPRAGRRGYDREEADLIADVARVASAGDQQHLKLLYPDTRRNRHDGGGGGVPEDQQPEAVLVVEGPWGPAFSSRQRGAAKGGVRAEFQSV